MTLSLTGKTALITGAARNIGRATAIALAEQGVNLVICTRKADQSLEDAAKEARDLGVTVLAAQCDVTKEDEVKSLVRQAVAKFGRIDILVNNATFRVHGKFRDLTLDNWSQAIAVNLYGPFYFCREILPLMVQNRWGRIINYSGNAAHRGNGAATSTVKAGIIGFTRSLAREYGKHNITVNSLSPGSIQTKRTPGTERESDLTGEVNPDLPIARFGTPEEVAALVTFLASEQAAYITGQSIGINGGAHFAF